jgi:type II secretory pathway component PulK
MRDDAMAGLNMIEETRGYYAAIGCMNQAIYYRLVAEQVPEFIEQMAQDATTVPLVPADGTPFPVTFGDQQCEVRMTDEGSRISLRKISPALLKAVIENLVRQGNGAEGLDRRQVNTVQTVVDSILDWTDRGDRNSARPYGAETPYYLGLQPPYEAKNAPIDSIEELALVRGVTAELMYGVDGTPGMVDVFTVFRSGDEDDEDDFIDDDDEGEEQDAEADEAADADEAGDDDEGGENVEQDLGITEIEPLHLATLTAPVLQALIGVDRETADELLLLRSTNPEDFRNQIAVEANGNPVVLAALGGDPDGGVGEIEEEDKDELGVVTIESRADVRQERNQARIAAVVDLGMTSEEGDRIVVKRWWDRAPWSLGDDEGVVTEGGDA